MEEEELRVSAFLTRKMRLWRGRRERGVGSRKRKRVEEEREVGCKHARRGQKNAI